VSRKRGFPIETGARRLTWEALYRIESAERADPILEQTLKHRGLSALDRAFITELVYGVNRQRGYLDHILSQRTERPYEKLSPRLKNLLRLGAYQILFLTKVPASAAVNESVKLAKTLGGKPVVGFVNAVLRSIVRNRTFTFPDPASDPVAHVAARYSHPAWLVRRWIGRYGLERTLRLCDANNTAAPLTIRVNRFRTTRDELSEALKKEGILSEPGLMVLEALKLKGISSGSGASLTANESFRRGAFYVQDEASQLISLLLTPKSGERILDACAAPGGKATHLAELMENAGEITALDVSEDRLDRMRQNIKRLGHMIIKPVMADATQDLTHLGAGSFDRILVDAPCSGLGLLRRNPEGKWKKTEGLIAHYSSIQKRILDRVAPLLKPGGVMVYSTCTTEPEENEFVAARFLLDHPSYKREGLWEILSEEAAGLITPEGAMNTLFNPFEMDYFFAVRFVKERRSS
jgi:16S rRNA (cytosine967-C5)-methyltransferase